MSNNFRKMTRVIAWLMSFGMVLQFAGTVQAIEFFSTPSRYQWVSQSGTLSADGKAHQVSANAGDTIAMSLTVKNRATDPKALVWYGKGTLLEEVAPYRGAHEIRLGVKNDQILPWVDASSFIANPDGAANRFAVYSGASVNPGQDMTLTWNLKIAAGTANGTYDLYTGVLREFDAWMKQVTASGKVLASEDIFWRFIIGGGSVTPVTGGLSVALSGGTPAAASIAKAGNANFTKFTLTAAAGATVKISSIYVTRTGLTADADVENIKILTADGVQVGNTSGGFDNNSRAQIFFSPQLEVTGSQDFFIRAGFTSTATTGLTAALGIAANADIVGNATSVMGAPVTGNYMTAVAVTIGTISVTEDGSITDTTPDVADKDVVVNAFKITAGSTEGIDIDRITVIKAGTSEVSDTNNIELWDVTNSKTLGTAATWTSDGKASWPVNISLDKGFFIRLEVRLDIVDGVSLTINADIADGSDYLVFGKGKLYGFYITPTAAAAANWTVASGGSNNLGQGDYNQTINAGAVTVSKSASTPPTGNIAVSDNQLLAVWDWQVLGEPFRISNVIVRGDLTDVSGSSVSEITYADMTNAYLVNMTTGDTLYGPVDGADGLAVVGTTAVDPKFTFSSTYVLPVGTTKVGFKVRLGTDWEATDTINVQLYQAADMTCKGVLSNDTKTPTGFASVGNTMTIKAGALVLRDLGVPASGNVIVGATDFTWATMALDATASGEDVLISSITVGDNVDATTGNMANLDNAELWADLDSNGSYETMISNTEQPTGAAGTDDEQAFTLTKSLRITKGTQIKIIFVADLASGAVALGTHQVGLVDDTVTTADVTAIGADTGTAITETDSGASGTMIVTANGSIHVLLDGSSPTSSIMLAGTSDNTVAKFKLTALDEPYRVSKVTLLLTDWGTSLDQWDSLESLTIEYPKQDGSTGIRSMTPSTTSALFDNIDMYVPKNASAVLTVKAQFRKIVEESADFGDQIEIGFDADSSGFLSVGLASGVEDNDADTDVTAQAHVLYKTLLTVTRDTAGMSSVLIPGTTNTLYKFKITADSRGAAALKKLTFSVSVTDNGTSSCNANVGGFTLSRDSVDITASKVLIAGLGGMTGSVSNSAAVERTTMETKGINDVAGTGTGSGTVGTVTTWVFAMFGATDGATQPETGDESIAAGATVSWTFSGSTGTGYLGADDDAVAVELLGDTTAPTDGYFDLGDDDVTNDEYSVVLALGSAGTTDTVDVEFIWTDNSAISHTGAMADNAGTVDTSPDSSSDFTNGYLIKNFPLGAWSIVA